MAKTPTEVALNMAKALEMRRANGGEIASFGTTPEKLRALATTPVTIVVERVRTRQSHIHSPGRGAAWYYHYEATGPDTYTTNDGRVLPRKFDNSSIVTLRSVLKKVYGRDTIIVESWKVGA